MSHLCDISVPVDLLFSSNLTFFWRTVVFLLWLCKPFHQLFLIRWRVNSKFTKIVTFKRLMSHTWLYILINKGELLFWLYHSHLWLFEVLAYIGPQIISNLISMSQSFKMILFNCKIFLNSLCFLSSGDCSGLLRINVIYCGSDMYSPCESQKVMVWFNYFLLVELNHLGMMFIEWQSSPTGEKANV